MQKSVSFNSKVKVQHMHAWSFAYRESRKSKWISMVLDRQRFESRKRLLEAELEKSRFFSRKIKKMSISWTVNIPRSTMQP